MKSSGIWFVTLSLALVLGCNTADTDVDDALGTQADVSETSDTPETDSEGAVPGGESGGDEEQAGDVDEVETGTDTGTGTDDSESTGIDIHGDSTVSCNGSPNEILVEVVGRSIQCQVAIDIHDGITAFYSLDNTPEAATVYEFDPSSWNLGALRDSLLAANSSNTDLVLDMGQLYDFVYEQGIEAGVVDEAGLVQEYSDAFARDILDTTHGCVSTYLQHYEVMFDCLDRATDVLPCGEASPAEWNPEDSCTDHNSSVTEFVRAYLNKLDVLSGSDERTVFESIVEDAAFSETVLSSKLTLADLYFYQYYYSKRDWDVATSDGEQVSHESFLNPNNWAKYPLIDASVESDCAGEDISRCCEYEAFINEYDSSPMELLELVNSCSNELAELGPYDNSLLYKVLLQNDGSVGDDGAFTIDEFFRPFILHYEKTTAPEQRGVCYWSALRDFAARTISVEAGNVNMEMNAQDMDLYIQSYNEQLASFQGDEAVESPTGICEPPTE